MPGAKVTNEKRDARCGKGPPQNLHHPESFALEPSRGVLDARVVTLGQHDTPPGAPRPLVERVAERHVANFFASACRTAGWTSCDTSPPKRATSRTRLELR